MSESKEELNEPETDPAEVDPAEVDPAETDPADVDSENEKVSDLNDNRWQVKESFQQRWQYSIMLLVMYLGLFHLWNIYHHNGNVIVASGIVISLLLARNLKVAWEAKYFTNIWDAGFHAVVILDIILEATIIDAPYHDNYGFYMCALGFTIFIGGYRQMMLDKTNDS
ncbi:MAG: hypothetical protein HRT89_11435 [Lentisphaeria bacterium]|nr:hypothetical protein [Lentisphaeria bacterium]NQZ68668.1 hypothetical protein [Lentisphaeria bacterium]